MGNRNDPVFLPEIMANGTGIMALAAAFQAMKQDQGRLCARQGWGCKWLLLKNSGGGRPVIVWCKRVQARNIPVYINEVIVCRGDSFTCIDNFWPGHEPRRKNGL